MIDPQELIDACHKLLTPPPSDADIQRAISTAHYALLSHLCECKQAAKLDIIPKNL